MSFRRFPVTLEHAQCAKEGGHEWESHDMGGSVRCVLCGAECSRRPRISRLYAEEEQLREEERSFREMLLLERKEERARRWNILIDRIARGELDP